MGTQSFGNVTFDVQPQELTRLASQVREQVNAMRLRFEAVERVMTRTRGYWIGEAGEAHRESYEVNREAIAEMFQRLRIYPDNLLKISGNYVSTDESLSGTLGGLQSNFLR